MLKIKLSKCAKEKSLIFPCSKQMAVCFQDGTNEDFWTMWEQAELIYCQMWLCDCEAFHHWPQKKMTSQKLCLKSIANYY